MTWLHRLGWTALASVTLAVAAIPLLVTLPEPEATLVLDHATFVTDNDTSSEVSLPHAVYLRIGDHSELVRYLVGFDLPAVPDNNLFVFIPSINRRLSLTFNGELFFGFESSTFWNGPTLSGSVMVRLPRRGIIAGRNQLTVTVETGRRSVPTYLSRIYLGPEAALAPNYQLRSFLFSQLKIMALAAQVLLGFGLIVAYFFRPKDPLFSWLATFIGASFVLTIGLFLGWQPAFQAITPLIAILAPTVGLLYLGVALAIIDVRPPASMRFAAIAAPFILLPCALFDTNLTRITLGAGAAVILIVAFVGAASVMAWGAWRRSSTDACLMLAPSFLLAWYSIRDAYVTATLPAHGFDLLVSYPRPLWLAVLTAVLMRRMGISLDQFDRANETLNIKLAEREAELAVVHQQEQATNASLVRDRERQRLTYDLHDGVSGHLASIIALAERAEVKPIEQTAREALNDLRMVIYSLDLSDRELPLALANFCERLNMQLHRLGIELDWSIAGLPEVFGVTPGNALAILRILQEAITNAIKHGPARKITVRGGVAADGMVVLTVENDGFAFVENRSGHGLANMVRRAKQLRGRLDIKSLETGVRVVLLLPSRLPDIEEDGAA